VVAGEAEVATLGGELRAVVGLGAVADDVAETPDLVRVRLLDLGEHRLEGGQVGVDVADDRGAHAGGGGRLS
jgi:hypothetical protein